MPKTNSPAAKRDVAEVRAALADALPVLLDRAIDNYRAFAMQMPDDDAKLFQMHQAACKAALSHVDLLVRLARDVVTVPDGDGTPRAPAAARGADTADLIARAEAAFRHYRDASA